MKKQPTQVKKYSWATPARYGSVKAEVLGPWLEHLPDRSPETFVEAARDESCPAHSLFEWDNGRAAHEHRLTQARLIFANLIVDVVVYRRSKPVVHKVRAFMRTSRAGEYSGAEEALGEPIKRSFVLAQALAQLSAIRRRYKTLVELADVFEALDRVEAKHSDRRRGKQKREDDRPSA